MVRGFAEGTACPLAPASELHSLGANNEDAVEDVRNRSIVRTLARLLEPTKDRDAQDPAVCRSRRISINSAVRRGLLALETGLAAVPPEAQATKRNAKTCARRTWDLR